VFAVFRHLSKGATAKVKIQLSHRAIPLETFKDNKQLGRIMLRKGGETVAAGVVDEVREKGLSPWRNLALTRPFCFSFTCFRFLLLVPDYLI
jgi:sulfate adenylyltransferase subunit 1 (EFTu-like GTPase family)